MIRSNLLFAGSVLLICSLVHCHVLTNEDLLNRRSWQVARTRRSMNQHIQRDPYLDDNREVRIPSQLPGEGQNDPKEYQQVLENMREILKAREEGSSEDQGPPQSRLRVPHHQKDSHHTHQHSVDHPLQELDHRKITKGQRGHQRLVIDNEGLEETDPRSGEIELPKERIPSSVERSESESEEENYDEEDSSESMKPRSRYEGYEKYEGVGIYKFHSESATSFDEANKICEEEGGHLAIASSKEEADVFVTLWWRHGPPEENDAYVGINNRNPQNIFRTVNGDTLVSTGYLAWRAGEPNNKNGIEQCVAFFRYGGYLDVPCYGPRPFICELKWRDEL